MLEHETYTKINTLYKRDEFGKIMLGDFSRPEFEYLFDNQWEWYLKIDGTNTGIYFDGELRIDGKSDRAQWKPQVKSYLESICDIERFKEIFHADDEGKYPNVIIYGETYGSGITPVGGNYFHGTKWGFRVFDIKINGFWLEMENVKDIAEKLHFEMPTYFGKMTIREAEQKVIEGFNDTISEKEMPAEGLVGRPMVQLFNKKGERVMVKVKSRDYKPQNISTLSDQTSSHIVSSKIL